MTVARWVAWLVVCAVLSPVAWSFCGFYVAQEPGSLFNRSSKVAIVRNGQLTQLTMANDYEGDVDEFGLVVPVPHVIKPGMVTVGERAAIEALDQYTVPRVAQYHDHNPCRRSAPVTREFLYLLDSIPAGRSYQRAEHGVKVERSYRVEEFEIQVVEATYGAGLQRWLRERGYHAPNAAVPILDGYIRQGMHFFLAKVDAKKLREAGHEWVRPLKISYRSRKFGLPIRLGTVSANGPQDLLVFFVTPDGRVETSNYQTRPMATDIEVPEWVADPGRFPEVYQSAFEHQVRRDRMNKVYLEYAWPLSTKCDPCSGPTLAPHLWASLAGPKASWLSGAFLTRLHVRYDASSFPADLEFLETKDRRPYQVRYVVHRAFTGEAECPEAATYQAQLLERRWTAEANLKDLTGLGSADFDLP